MIKLKKDNLIILGLSDENLRRLKNNEPIRFNLKDLDLQDIDVVIFNGKDENTMLNTFLDQIGPETKLK